MEEKNELIILEQLPIIKTRLEKISTEIKEKVDKATSLVVNEDTVKEVKQVRANLTKEFNELETQRKQVKQAIMSKYDEFEEIYKENVSNLYKEADATLKEKIDNVENQLKQEKEEELKEFANQHIEANNLQDIISFENIGLNITLSASIKSLKEQVLEFINKVVNDLKLIDMEEYKDEILIEYKKNRNFMQSKIDVTFRHQQLDNMKKRDEDILKMKIEEQKTVEKVESALYELNENTGKYEEIKEITPPKEIIQDDEVIKVQFTITDTKEKILKLKEFLKENDINYE